MKHLSIIVLFICLLCGCKSIQPTVQEVPIEITKEVPVETSKTERSVQVRIDTVIVKDSIDRYVKNDTIIIYKERNTFKYRTIIDTLIVRDTIPMITTVEVPVTVIETKIEEVNVLKWYQKWLMTIGLIFMIYVAILILFKCLRGRL